MLLLHTVCVSLCFDVWPCLYRSRFPVVDQKLAGTCTCTMLCAVTAVMQRPVLYHACVCKDNHQ